MGGGVVMICASMHVVRWCGDVCIHVMGTWDSMVLSMGRCGGGVLV